MLLYSVIKWESVGCDSIRVVTYKSRSKVKIMALINCPECNKEISDTVKICPHCGYKLPKTKNVQSPQGKRKRVVIIISGLLALIAIGGFFFFLSPHTVEWFCYHHVSDATCIEPKKCSRCGKVWGEPLGHDWQEATCTTPKTCTVCGITEGIAIGHDWQEATCTTPKTCKICGKKVGRSIGHVLKNYICTKCGESIVKKSDVENILDITLLQYEVNYVGGIDIYMTFSNKLSTKNINYITVEMEFYNAVGDVLTDDISKAKMVSLVFTGPLKAGEKSDKTYWRACFYNSTFSGTIHLNKIIIDYSDGSTITLDEDIARYAVKNWR